MTVRILKGDCRETLRALPDGSVHMAVTSPPYYGLRDYGVDPTLWGGLPDCEHEFVDETVQRQIRKGMGLEELGKRYRGGGKKHGRLATTFEFKRGFCVKCDAWRGVLGLEPNYQMFVDNMVEVFTEVRRVLRDDGTLWLNLGDSYATGAGAVGARPGGGEQGDRWAGYRGGRSLEASGKHGAIRKIGSNRAQRGDGNDGVPFGPMIQPNRMPQPGMKPKDLMGMPWRVAFALQAAGWWLRQDIVWEKPNPMPESIEDRCTKAHEYLFLLCKSSDYYYDAEAIKEDASDNTHARSARDGFKANGMLGVNPKSAGEDTNVRAKGSWHASTTAVLATRNKRSVWTVATQPFPEAHFATFPPALIEPCVLAGTSERGCCPTCKTGWVRVTAPTERYAKFLGRSYHDHEDDAGKGQMQQRGENRQNLMKSEGGMIGKETETIGWYPDCDCAGLPRLPKLPPPPREEDGETKAAREIALEGWRVACLAVHAQWRRMCEPASSLSTVPAVVLDPFGGAGTTGLVADRLQRDAILCELNPQYAEMAVRRLQGDGGLFSKVAAE